MTSENFSRLYSFEREWGKITFIATLAPDCVIGNIISIPKTSKDGPCFSVYRKVYERGVATRRNLVKELARTRPHDFRLP